MYCVRSLLAVESSDKSTDTDWNQQRINVLVSHELSKSHTDCCSCCYFGCFSFLQKIRVWINTHCSLLIPSFHFHLWSSLRFTCDAFLCVSEWAQGRRQLSLLRHLSCFRCSMIKTYRILPSKQVNNTERVRKTLHCLTRWLYDSMDIFVNANTIHPHHAKVIIN